MYFFLTEDFTKVEIYIKKFNEIRQGEREFNKNNDKLGIVDFEKVEGIQESLKTLLKDFTEETQVERVYFTDSSSNDYKNNEMKQEKETINLENMTNYMNLIPFKLEELKLGEQQTLADNLFYEYFSSLGININLHYFNYR